MKPIQQLIFTSEVAEARAEQELKLSFNGKQYKAKDKVLINMKPCKLRHIGSKATTVPKQKPNSNTIKLAEILIDSDFNFFFGDGISVIKPLSLDGIRAVYGIRSFKDEVIKIRAALKQLNKEELLITYEDMNRDTFYGVINTDEARETMKKAIEILKEMSIQQD